jgi:hypothetical protein
MGEYEELLSFLEFKLFADLIDTLGKMARQAEHHHHPAQVEVRATCIC